MNWQEVWGVLKWILAALVAGFVGQFGKSLALLILKHRRTRKEVRDHSYAVGVTPKASPAVSNEKKSMDSNQAKIEKKKAKAQVKRLKKS
jgi:hypothetical protein